MKFILNEAFKQKYILDENFNLSERFVLDESASDNISNLIEKINKKLLNYTDLKAIQTKLATNNNNDKVTLLNELKQTSAEVEKGIESKAADDININNIKNYFSKLKELLIKADIDYNEIPNIKKIIDDFDKLTDTAKAIQYINLYNKINPLATGIFIDTKAAANNSELADQVKDLISNKDSLEKNLKEINNIADETNDNFFENILTKLEEALPEKIYKPIKVTSAEGTGAEKTDFEISDYEINELTKNVTEANNAINTFNNTYAQKDNEAVKQKVEDSAKRDWKTYIGKAENKEAAWDEYFKTEWGNNAEKVKELGRAFYLELQDLGFNATSNPFINFVKNYYLTGKFDLSRDKYAVLHNAYADNIIDKDDLFGNGTLGKDNVVFNPDLYKQESTDIGQYLKLQKFILDHLNVLDPDVKKNFSDNVTALIDSILYTNGNPITNMVPATSKTLKPYNKAKELANQCFPGIKVDQALPITDGNLNAWFKDYTVEKAKKAIGYLWANYHLVYQAIFETVAKYYPEIEQMILPTSKADFAVFDHDLHMDNMKFDEKIFASALGKLATIIKTGK